jgi:hypothetical protein
MTNKLDIQIEDELLLMLAEGYEHSPISASSLHKRLLAKGIVKGALSTLSTPIRKHLISLYREQQIDQTDEPKAFKEFALKGKTNQALQSRIKELKAKNELLENQLTMNTESLLKIVKEVRNKTPIRVDHLLAPFLIKELLKEKS